MDNDKIESGSLSSVLRKSSHEELVVILDAIDRGIDVRPKRSTVYKIYKDDLTRIPEMIDYWLCACGGHAVRNLFRDGGPPYQEVVYDVTRKVGVKNIKNKNDVLEMEGALLVDLVAKAWERMSQEEKAAFTRKLNEKLDVPIDLAQLLAQGINGFGAFSSILFTLLAKLLAKESIGIAAAEIAGVTLGGALSGVGALAGVLWLGYDLGGPSYRGTIPAVVQVALLRQQMMWSGR